MALVQQYLVLQDHSSEYPEPITFRKGAPLSVGERYEGPEGWEDWFFCETPGQQGGWVPAQIIEYIGEGEGTTRTARAREDYTARELDVRAGDLLLGSRILNGWSWCETPNGAASGWVPLAKLGASTSV